MLRHSLHLLLTSAVLCLFACQDDPEANTSQGMTPKQDPGLYTFDLPGQIPPPKLPDDRPLLEARIELGRYLFYDTRLSGNQTQACASCHKQELAFTDGRQTGLGSTDESHVRNAMSLVNVAYNTSFGWAGPAVTSLEDQAAIPLFGEFPVELGLMNVPTDELIARFSSVPRYQELFAQAYPDLPEEERISVAHITESIADFERTLLSFDSPYDRFTYGGDKNALSESEQRGMELFFSERLECFHCHGGFNFSDAIDHEGLAFPLQTFHNTGLYNIDGMGAYPQRDRGVYDVTGKALDMGRFKAPTLRNIAVTAPFFHDGSAATLEEVIAHYERGGRAILSGDDFGDGAQNPLKSELIQGFILTSQEREDLIAFLEALTDEHFLTRPDFAQPADLELP